jgi:hypothetical protein
MSQLQMKSRGGSIPIGHIRATRSLLSANGKPLGKNILAYFVESRCPVFAGYKFIKKDNFNEPGVFDYLAIPETKDALFPCLYLEVKDYDRDELNGNQLCWFNHYKQKDTPAYLLNCSVSESAPSYLGWMWLSDPAKMKGYFPGHQANACRHEWWFNPHTGLWKNEPQICDQKDACGCQTCKEIREEEHKGARDKWHTTKKKAQSRG